jgi:anti-sigma B factor antagonist
MRVSERRFGDVVVLDLHGPIAGQKAVTMLESAVRRQCREGVRDVVANLGGVPSIDLAGLGALVDAHVALGPRGDFKLACITKRIHDLVVITRLLTLFDTYDSVEEAVGGAAQAHTGATSPQLSEMSLAKIHRFLRRA